MCPEVVVESVEKKATEHLQRVGRTLPSSPLTIKQTVNELLRHPAVSVSDER